MKGYFKLILQKLFGFENFLYWFSVFKITFLKWDRYEKPLFTILDKIEDKGLILDVGANIGIISVHFAKKFPQLKIIGFEPVPFNQATFVRICNRYKLNNVVLEKYALGNKNEKTFIQVPVQNKVTMQGLAHISNEKIPNAISFEIKIKRLDEIEKYSSETISAIKIDVENFEYEVLLGAINTIKRNLPLLYIELWDNDNRNNCIQLLTEIGYKCYYFESNDWLPYSSTSNKPKKSQNFLFIHASKLS